jgi:error-prone DNA polymerase
VRVLPPCVFASDWDCTLEPDPRSTREDDPRSMRVSQGSSAGDLALRIGLRQVRSLREDEAARIVAARGGDGDDGPPTTIAELGSRAALGTATLQRLAEAGALRALGRHRHAASWDALAAEPPPGPLPLRPARETAHALPAPSEAQEILADYRQLALSTGRHPLALLRPELSGAGIRSGLELRGLPDGSAVRAAGLVTHLQRPGTAAGVVFLSLEDETGIVNVILWPQVYEAQRELALAASLLVVSGELQNREGVVHVVARRLHDRSRWLAGLARRSRDFH